MNNKENTSRVVPDRSAREIIDLKEKFGTELRTSLYLYNNERFIVCSIACFAEYGTPKTLDLDTSDDELGLALCDKLLEFRPELEDPRPSRKLTDWAAFKASGAKTVKSFENKSTFVYVRTVNTAIDIEAAPRVTLEKELKARCVISNTSSHSEIGRAIRKAIKAANVLRQASML